jgi:hypothetical protein
MDSLLGNEISKETLLKESFQKNYISFFDSVLIDLISEYFSNNRMKISSKFSEIKLDTNSYQFMISNLSFFVKNEKRIIDFGVIMKNSDLKTTRFVEEKDGPNFFDHLDLDSKNLIDFKNIKKENGLIWEKIKNKDKEFIKLIVDEILVLITIDDQNQKLKFM